MAKRTKKLKPQRCHYAGPGEPLVTIMDDWPELMRIEEHLSKARQRLDGLLVRWENEPGPDVDQVTPALKWLVSQLDGVLAELNHQVIPHAPCICDGVGSTCTICGGSGWLTLRRPRGTPRSSCQASRTPG